MAWPGASGPVRPLQLGGELFGEQHREAWDCRSAISAVKPEALPLRGELIGHQHREAWECRSAVSAVRPGVLPLRRRKRR